MKFIYIIVLSIGILLIASCVLPKAHTGKLPLDERVENLERRSNTEKPNYSEDELRSQFQADLVELKRIGLTDRALQDFNSRLSNATVKKWSIGFFMDTNTVWCDIRYTLPSNEEIFQKEFGYTRRVGTNIGAKWNLIWELERKQ